jgi:large subunit ribosomal protein L15
MKLHDLKPAPGSRKARRRVGRGIAAGQGKTAGRGTKGQKARAGGSIPAWFEGGQTPLHQRIPKLRGFRNPFKIDYEIVNIGAIGRLADLGALEPGEMPGSKKTKGAAAPVTVNQEILRAAGLVRRLDKPMKVLGNGEVSAALFVVADAFSASAKSKIEAAGGTVSVLEVPASPIAALGIIAPPEAAAGPAEAAAAPPEAAAAPAAPAEAAPTVSEASAETVSVGAANETEAPAAAAAARSAEADATTAPAPRRDGSKASPKPEARAKPKATAKQKATAKPKAAARAEAPTDAEPEASAQSAAGAEPDAPAE